MCDSLEGIGFYGRNVRILRGCDSTHDGGVPHAVRRPPRTPCADEARRGETRLLDERRETAER